MSAITSAIPIHQDISPLASQYRAWLCDIWGVVHNGVNAFVPATNALKAFKAQGGHVILLTNAPRPSTSVEAQLDALGVTRDAYDAVVSSGDVARTIVSQKPGCPVFHLGPDRDRGIIEGLDIQLVDKEKAEIVLCSGLFDDETETADDYRELLSDLKKQELPFICANPDIVVERGDKIVYCAGALAEAYDKLGGPVIYTGKPHPPIYDLAFKKLAEIAGNEIQRSQVLAIGDGLKTDMPGAAAAGLDSVFVASAIHVDGHKPGSDLDRDAIDALFAGAQTKPIAVLSHLEWS